MLPCTMADTLLHFCALEQSNIRLCKSIELQCGDLTHQRHAIENAVQDLLHDRIGFPLKSLEVDQSILISRNILHNCFRYRSTIFDDFVVTKTRNALQLICQNCSDLRNQNKYL